MTYFTDKVVWITGASSGIGEALAYTFAKQGSKLILSARRSDELQRVKSNCGIANDRVLVLPFDVSDFEAASTSAQQALAHFGQIDILVNNAGLSHWTKVKDLSLGVIRKIMDVNFLGGVALTKAVLTSMLEKKQGQIVVISSVLGKMYVMKQAAYVASKHALQGFYDTLRIETEADGIKVLIVSPGFVRTNVAKNSLNRDGVAINTDNEKIVNGLDPLYVSDKILDAIVKGKDEIVLAGASEKAGIFFKRLFPSFFAYLMKKRKIL